MIFLSNYCISMSERLLETPDDRMVIPRWFASPIRAESRGVMLRVSSTSALLSGHCVSFNFLLRWAVACGRGIRAMPMTVIWPLAAMEERVSEL
jgi:hypothetical protein